MFRVVTLMTCAVTTTATSMRRGARVAAQITDLDRSKIEVRMTRVGGGFGRRLTNAIFAASGKRVRNLPIRAQVSEL